MALRFLMLSLTKPMKERMRMLRNPRYPNSDDKMREAISASSRIRYMIRMD